MNNSDCFFVLKNNEVEGDRVKRFIDKNRKLSYITIISVAIVLSYYFSYNCIEIISGINKWYELLVTISVGFIVNCIFYIFQVYIPKSEDEARTQKALAGKLYDLYSSLIEVIELSEYFYDGIQENAIVQKTNYVAYKIITGNNEKGMARKISIEQYSSILKRVIDGLEAFTEKDLFARCSTEYMDLLIDIRENSYLKDLLYAYERQFPKNTTYGGLNKEYQELLELLQQLNNMFLLGKKVLIESLTDEEAAILNAYDPKNATMRYINLGLEGFK